MCSPLTIQTLSPLRCSMLQIPPGLKRFPNSGGQMMKADGGCAVVDNIIHDGKRQSAYRSYVYPRLHAVQPDRSNGCPDNTHPL